MIRHPARDVARAVAGAVLMLLAVLMMPAESAAQKLYTAAQLTQAPKVVSMEKTARMIQGSYPDHLRSRGIGGTVQLQFVVGPDGKVEPSSVEVLATTVEELGEAAKRVAERLEFFPPKVKDVAVRAKVILPIVYRAS
ncbi:MAG: energy transducer TonB [Longimicrobiales bacterium]